MNRRQRRAAGERRGRQGPVPEDLLRVFYGQVRRECPKCRGPVWWLSETEAVVDGLAISEAVETVGAGGRVWQCQLDPEHYGYVGPVVAGA